MVTLIDKDKCCGCAACVDSCFRHAIRLEKDENGFSHPVVDEPLCIACGECKSVCPCFNARLESGSGREDFQRKFFIAAHKNYVTLFDSGAGGVFSALANVIYKNKGFVGGAVINEDLSVCQILSESKSDLPKVRNVKFSQSDARGFYLAVKNAVSTGRMVLAVGCPCQILALKNFLGRDYENLILVDFSCQGVSSDVAFRSYLKEEEQKNGSAVVGVKQRTKELGWRRSSLVLKLKDGRVVYASRPSLPLRDSCVDCQFESGRLSDITLREFDGGVGISLLPEFTRDLGVTVVCLNTKKGEKLFDAAKSSCVVQPVLENQIKVTRPCGSFARTASVRKRSNPRMLFKALSCIRWYLRRVGYSPWSAVRGIRINGWRSILSGRPLILISRNTIFENRGSIDLSGNLVIGGSYYYKEEPVRSAIGIKAGGRLCIKGDTGFVYGADIEILENATLEMGGEGGFNIGATIVCGESIKIGKGVMAGRYVTIRDNNGGHWMNFPGYKNSKPVEIGDHVWLCEGCTIMPGVKIGAGAVIGAKAVVFNNVPANTMVMGNPAQVVCEQVEWKY